MSDTRDSMPAADDMPQPGEHLFNTKPRDGVVENGADEPTMSTADQEAEKQKEFDKFLQKGSAELLALSKRKLEAETAKAEEDLSWAKEKKKFETKKAEDEATKAQDEAKKAQDEAKKAEEELSLAQEKKKIELALAQEKTKIELALAQEKKDIELKKSEDEAKKAEKERMLAERNFQAREKEDVRNVERHDLSVRTMNQDYERVQNYMTWEKPFVDRAIDASVKKKMLENQEKEQNLDYINNLEHNAKKGDQKDQLAYLHLKKFDTTVALEQVKSLNMQEKAYKANEVSIVQVNTALEGLRNKLIVTEPLMAKHIVDRENVKRIETESRDAEIVHLNKKAKIEAEEIVHLNKKAKIMRELSFPVGTRVKAIMDRQGSTEKRYRMGKIIGFSRDLFQVKFDYPPDQLFQDTAFENIILYEPAPEPNPVDDAVLDDADL